MVIISKFKFPGYHKQTRKISMQARKEVKILRSELISSGKRNGQVAIFSQLALKSSDNIKRCLVEVFSKHYLPL